MSIGNRKEKGNGKMALLDLKFNESDFNGRKIGDLSDTPSSDGLTAEALKAYFDYIPKTMIAFGAINRIIDLLVSSAGAEDIGASVPGVTGTHVQAILESTKAMLDDRYTKSAADGLLSKKADNSVVDAMVKSISFDQDTGIFTITEQGGKTYTIDTLLEKLAVNFIYDETTQSLIVTLSDGTTQTVPLSDFITEIEIQSTSTIAVTETSGVITLNIKTGSITDDMLSSALLNSMQGYAQSCALSASNAEANANNAKTYSDSAASSASAALTSENSAAESALSALTSKNSASTSETNAAKSAAKAQAAQIAAEKARDEAKEIAGGDYVTNAQFGQHTQDGNLHTSETEKQRWNNKVDKVEGKGLSSNDFSNDDKTKLSSINSSAIIRNNVAVETSAWASDTTYESYPYRASVAITDCTADHVPDVAFSLEDVSEGNLAPLAETYAGGIYIYAKEKPSAQITVPTILLIKVVK